MLLGDAVFNFTADTTQLDEAFQKVQSQAESALAPAAEAAQGLSDAVEQVGTSATVAAEAMAKAGSASQQAATQASSAWQRVAQATSANIQAQNDLRAAMSAVRKTGGESESALQLLAKAQEQAAKTALDLAAAQKAVVTGAREEAVAVKEADEAFNMGEAKATIALLGDEVGVKIPRHLRGFVAQLPGVGEALNAAFEFTAGLVLLQILAEGADKLSQWVADTYIFTEADKAAYKAQVDLNTAILDSVTKLDQLKKAYDTIGLTGSTKTRTEFMQFTQEVKANEKALRDAKDALGYYSKGFADQLASPEQIKQRIDQANTEIARLTPLLQMQYQQQANMAKQYDQESLDESIQHGNAQLEADKRVAEARFQLQSARNQLLLAQGKISMAQEIVAEHDLEEKKYQAELDGLNKRKKLLAEDPTKNADALKQVNAEIEALEKEHEAKSLQNYATYLNMMKAARNQALDALQQSNVPAQIITPTTQAFDALNKAMKDLGLTSSADLHQAAENAAKNFSIIQTSALSSARDILQAEKAWLQLQISSNKQAGLGVTDLEKRLKDVDKALDTTGAKFDITGTKFKHMVELWKQGAPSAAQSFHMIADIAKESLDKMGDAMEGAITSWIDGEESLGKALKKGTADVLAEVAARAAVYAMFYTAYGFAMLATQQYDKAAQAFTAAAEFAATAIIAGAAAYGLSDHSASSSGSSSASSGPTPSGSSVQPSAQPVQVTNVQRFAAGALVSRPTLAMIGDGRNGGSQREAVLPLEDRGAMRAIAAAIGEHMGGAGGSSPVYVHVEGMISPDNLTEVIHQITNQVEHKNVRLAATHARRVTKV